MKERISGYPKTHALGKSFEVFMEYGTPMFLFFRVYEEKNYSVTFDSGKDLNCIDAKLIEINEF